MDYLMIALTALVIEIMFIMMLFCGLYLRKKSPKNSFVKPQFNKNNPKLKEYSAMLHKHMDKVQVKYDRTATNLGVKHHISECPPDSHALIACIHCHYDYVLCEISAVELGEISVDKIGQHQQGVRRIISEFEAIESNILNSGKPLNEGSAEVKALHSKLKQAREIDENESKSYLYDLKKESVFNKRENKKLLQQLDIFKDRVRELEESKDAVDTNVEDVSSEMYSMLKNEKSELEDSLYQANERITDLKAYKARFDELQSQVSSESDASVELRQDLRNHVEGTESEDEIDKLISEYETVRTSLDDFMERPDIAPMAAISRSENDEKIAEMNQAMDSFAKECCLAMKEDTFQLAELNSSESDTVKKLQHELQQVTIDKDRLQQNLDDLEQSIKNKGKIISNLEKSISGKEGDIEQLQEKMRQVSTKNASIADLELTVERFSRQSMTMMQQIMDLEEENSKLKEQIH